MHEPPRRPGEPVDEASRPATLDELRSLRRWMLVAGAWAVAATAIAVIALIAANREEDNQDGVRTASQIGRVQRQLNGRLDDLEARLADLPESEDVARLDGRLKQVENDTGKTADQVEELSGRLDELEGRVETLEESAAGAETTETETTP